MKFLALSLFFIVLVYGLSVWNTRHTRKYPPFLLQPMEEVLNEAQSLTVESTREPPLVAAMHSSEAAGMLRALRTLAPEDDLNRLFNRKYAVQLSLTQKARKLGAERTRKLMITSVENDTN